MREKPTRSEQEQLDSVLRWLQKRDAYLAVAITRLGQVCFFDEIETAAILVNGPDVQLLFNRSFFHELREKQLAAILIHESMHFVFHHQARALKIRGVFNRTLFSLSCEAVINDIIMAYFPTFDLPGNPVTGQSLVGQDTSTMSAEQVMGLLLARVEKAPGFAASLLSCKCTDDHWIWDSEEACDGWTRESSQLADSISRRFGGRDGYGSSPLGRDRLVPKRKPRTDLRKFLLDCIKPSCRYKTVWSQPNHKAISVYPQVILPVYERDETRRTILMAVDTSGSVPADFLGSAIATASMDIPGNRVRLITFDTMTYEYKPGSPAAKGGGGTRIQAVEEYAGKEMEDYPDVVFIFTDGFSPRPLPRHPERWIWILPPFGTDRAVPAGSRVELFEG